MTLADAFAELESRDWSTPDRDRPLNMAVVGMGWFASEVAIPAIESAEGTSLTVVVTGSEEKARQAEAQHDLAATLTYEEYHEGEASEAYDAVYVATPNVEHLHPIQTAAELGKDVLTEKPLETSVDRAQRAIEACEDAGVTLMVGYRMQLDPAIRQVKHVLSEGAIGDISLVHGTFSFPTLAMSGPDSWRFDAEVAGGGAFVDLGVYPVNTTRFLLDRDPTSATATATARAEPFEALEATGESTVGVEENIGAVLDFGGPIATFTASFNGRKSSRLEFVGTEGRLSIRPAFEVATPRRIALELGSNQATVETGEQNEIVEMFDYFAGNVQRGETPTASGADGLQDLRVVRAVYESAADGKRVSLE